MGIEIIVAVAVGAAVLHGTGLVAVAIGVGLAAGIGASFLFGSASKKPKPSQPDFGSQGSLASSPSYGRFGPLQNTITDKLPIACQFGRVQTAGNVVWQSEPGDEVTQVVILGQGEVEDIEEIRINDRPWQQFSGVVVEKRLGLLNQGVPSIVTDADPDVEGLDLRRMAYLSVKLKSSDDLSGSAVVTTVCRGLRAQTYNEAYYKDVHSFESGDAHRPVNSSEVQNNDGFYQTFSSPATVRLSDIEVGLSWREGDQADEDNADWLRSEYAYMQLYSGDSTGAKPTGDVLAESSRVPLLDISAKNNGSDYEDYNVARFFFPSGDSLVLNNTDKYAFVLRTSYAKAVRKNCIHVLGDFTSSSYSGGSSGYLLSGAWTQNASSSLCFRINMFQSNNNGWSNGPYWTRNPAAIIREILLNKHWGIGKASGDLLDASFGEAYEHCKSLVGDGDGHYEPRYEIDFNMDSYRPAVDQLEDLAASFLGYYVREGNQIGLGIHKSGDSVHSFGDGSDLDVFSYDNIVENSFRWRLGSLDDLANRTIVRYIEPGEKWNESTVEFNDRINQEDRDLVVPEEMFFPTVIRRSQATRLGKYHSLTAKYAGVEASWTGFIEANHVQVGDVVSVYHKAGLYENKKFRITSRIKNNKGHIEFVGREYFDSLFDDTKGISAPRRLTPTGPNIFAPIGEVSNLSATEISQPQGTFGPGGDGRIVSNIDVTWTEISESKKLYLRHYLVQTSTDGGTTWRDVFLAHPGTSFVKIPDVEVGLTYVVRVKTVSQQGVHSAGVTDSVTIEGKDDPPGNVTGFDVSQFGDKLRFSWDAVDDLDLARYIIKQGPTWSEGQVIAELVDITEYEYPVGEIGTLTFMVKAVDFSGNESTSPAIDTLNVVDPPELNFTVVKNIFEANTRCKLINMSRIWTTDYDRDYYRPALALQTVQTWNEKEAEGSGWEQQEASGGLLLDRPALASGTYEQLDAFDLETAFSFQIQPDIDYVNFSGGSVVIEESHSITSSDFTAFAPVDANTLYQARYVKFRYIVKTTVSGHNVVIYDGSIALNAPITQVAFGSDVAIPASGLTIDYGKTYTFAPRIKVQVVNGVIGIPVVSNKTLTQFDVDVYDDGGSAIGTAEIDWEARGS